jgi:hypothetical protein
MAPAVIVWLGSCKKRWRCHEAYCTALRQDRARGEIYNITNIILRDTFKKSKHNNWVSVFLLSPISGGALGTTDPRIYSVYMGAQRFERKTLLFTVTSCWGLMTHGVCHWCNVANNNGGGVGGAKRPRILGTQILCPIKRIFSFFLSLCLYTTQIIVSKISNFMFPSSTQ